MINKLNFNLKYLIIAVVSISLLMVATALIFTFINLRAEKSPSLDVQPAVPAEKAMPAPTAPLVE